MLSSFGGVVGFALESRFPWVLTKRDQFIFRRIGLPVVIPFPVAIVAMVFSAADGIFFGLYPVHRASRLDPIDAPRYE